MRLFNLSSTTTTAAVAKAAATGVLVTAILTSPLGPSNAMPFLARYNTANDIPDSFFQRNLSINGRVVKVTDGDTVRIRHLPFYPLATKGEYTGKLSENTISVRVYAVDAPEIAKFGNPSMPKAEEAKSFTDRWIGNKVVSVKLLSKDQYGRVVGRITTRGYIPLLLPRRDLSMDLAKNGYATLYTGRGAQYDGRREKLESLIQGAKRRKKGIWYDGTSQVETPAEYKRRVKMRPATAY